MKAAKVKVKFEKSRRLCWCPTCEEEHWLAVWLDCYEKTKKGDRLIVMCRECETLAVDRWRRSFMKKGKK